MMKWVVLILAVLFVTILLQRLRIELEYVKEDETNHLILNFSTLFGLLHYKKKIELKVKPDKLAVGIKEKSGASAQGPTDKDNFSFKRIMQKIDDMKKLLQLTRSLKQIVTDFLHQVTIHELQFVSDIGDEDVVKAAKNTGYFWGVIGSLMALIQTLFKLCCVPELVVNPIFHRNTFTIRFRCIFDFKVGHLIWAGLKFIFSWKGKKKFFFIPVFSKSTMSP